MIPRERFGNVSSWVARTMGTSIEMVDKTYGHLAAGSEESIRARRDAFAH